MQRRQIMSKLGLPKGVPCIVTSSANGGGVDELRRVISQYVADFADDLHGEGAEA
jgi:hypothetical protein